MGELQVRAMGQLIVLADGDRLGFGRVNSEPGSTRGWGYDGRFLELSEQSYVHRIWGEIASDAGMWRVRSLGTRHPVTVVPEGHRPMELAPRRDDAAPSEFAVTQPSFDIVLSVAAQTFRLECTRSIPAGEMASVGAPALGNRTVTLGEEMADCVTATEFPVLWVMSRQYRSDPPEAQPAPLSYARICRALDLSEKQAVSAVARVVRRFRSTGLMPAEVPAASQRDWICRQVVAHAVLVELARRHGTPPAD